MDQTQLTDVQRRQVENTARGMAFDGERLSEALRACTADHPHAEREAWALCLLTFTMQQRVQPGDGGAVFGRLRGVRSYNVPGAAWGRS